MNKIFSRQALVVLSSSRRQAMLATRYEAILNQHQFASFHAGGHNHDNDDDDGKQSHSDFSAKAKKAPLTDDQLTAQFGEWLSANDVVLFMKGNKKMPRCGFSNYTVQILKFYNVANYKDVDVLADEAVREGIKKYSNWPTIPQLYVKGQFVGGCDILKEMHQDGSFEELLVRENIIKK